MASETIYALEASNISISGGGQLSGISQGDGNHLDGLTITLLTNDWVAVQINDTDANFDDSDGSQTLDGDQAFDQDAAGVDIVYDDNIRVEAEYRIVVTDPNGVEYTLLALNFNEPGVTSFSTVEGLAFVDTGLGFPPIGATLTVQSTHEGPSVPYSELAVPPCFTPGTRICTSDGLVDVAELEIGDRILTMDRGLQTIRWVGHTRLPAVVLGQTPKFRPVVIRQDALGPGLPFHDMKVSPQHRILITGWQAELLFGEDEILVPAIKLCNGATIYQDAVPQDVTYIHVLFDQHEVIWADGIPTESYLPAINDVSEMADELTAIFPQRQQGDVAMSAVRTCVSDRRATVIAA